jgi:hypothetical protein
LSFDKQRTSKEYGRNRQVEEKLESKRNNKILRTRRPQRIKDN